MRAVHKAVPRWAGILCKRLLFLRPGAFASGRFFIGGK